MEQTPFAKTLAQPYWLEDAPLSANGPEPLPPSADLVVVGSGYTGLSAAIEAARGGMSVLVLDRGAIGAGCSTRNGGQVSSSIKPELGKLTVRHGADLARRIRDEGYAALAHTEALIAANRIDCDWQKSGRYIAAHSPKQFDGLARLVEARARAGEPEMTLVPQSQQLGELGSDRYFGGAVTAYNAAVQPAKLHVGLLRLAEGLGVVVQGGHEVTGIARDGAGFRVRTGGGDFTASRVVVTAGAWVSGLVPALAGVTSVRRQVLHWFPVADPAAYAPGRFPIFIWMHGVGAGAARAAACLYTVSRDSGFIVDEVDGVVVASPCSGHGFKHSAGLGEALAARACGAGPALDAFRLARFG